MLQNTALHLYAGASARRPSRHSDSKETTVLKKTCVASGMLIAAAAGATITSLPAFASTPTYGGGCCSSTRFAHFSHNRSWNGSENEALNHIRLHIRNRNNNIAVARAPQRERRREEGGGGEGAGAPVIGAPGA
jgi:hypothetical protein